MKPKTQFILVVTTLAVAGVLMMGSSSMFKPQQPVPQTSLLAPEEVPPLQDGEAALLVRYADGKQRVFVGGVVAGMTVFDAITQSSLAGNFAVETKSGTEDAVWVASLDGVEAQGEGLWKVYRGGEDMDGRIAVEEIHAGDKVELRYE